MTKVGALTVRGIRNPGSYAVLKVIESEPVISREECGIRGDQIYKKPSQK